MHVEERRIDSIRIGARCRKDVGDVTTLAASIETIGLLHPVVIRPDGTLVAGERRIAAFRHLKRDTVPCAVALGFDETVKLLRAEQDENTERKAFLISEALALAAQLEDIEREEARKRQEATRAQPGNDGRNPAGAGKFPAPEAPPETQPKAAPKGRSRDAVGSAVGMSGRNYQKAKEVADAAAAEPEKYQDLADKMDETGKVDGAYKQLKTRRQAEKLNTAPPPTPEGPFDVIVIDPPWTYDARGTDVTHRAANPYPSMKQEDLLALKIPAKPNCVLWLWTTNAHMHEAYHLLEAWDFTPKTILTWAKDQMGTGDWLRGKTEHCILATKGKPTVTLTNQTTLLQAHRGEHSAKPAEFYALVEGLCPGSRLDMFARGRRDGWFTFGDEVPRD